MGKNKKIEYGWSSDEKLHSLPEIEQYGLGLY
jgi:hypothetical protein